MSDTAKASGGSARSSGGAGLASLGKGGKWLGGIVVVALVGALIPLFIDSFKSPEEIGADFDKPSIANPMSLDEYARRQRGSTFAALPGGAPAIRLVAYDAAATSAEVPEVEPQPEVPPPGDEIEDPPAEDATTTPDEPPTVPENTTTTPPDEDAEDDPVTTPPAPPVEPRSKLQPGDKVQAQRDPIVPLQLEDKEIDKVQAGMVTALDAPGVPADLDIPATCLENASDESCGLAAQLEIADEDGKARNVSTAAVSKRLAEVFKGTRTMRVKEPGKPATRELVGVMVSYTVKLTGLRGNKTRIRWSLLSAGASSVRDPWLVNRQVGVLSGKANSYKVGGRFWVPLPEEPGPFYIRIEATGADGEQLNYSETDHFR